LGTVTSMTRKGQVTIPKEVRDVLGLKPFDTIEIRIEDGTATLRKARLALDEIAGILPPLGIPIEEMPAIAMDDWGADFAEKER